MSRNYATQKEAAVKGIITPEMKTVAAYENIDEEILRERIARGTVVIPANINHKNLKPMAVGEGLSTKINVNLGISQDCCDYELELGKVKLAEELEAHAVMDLSCWGKTADFRKRLIEESSLMVGTVPLYDVRGNKDKPMLELTVDDYFEVAEQHAREGVDFLTIHAGLNRKTAQRLKDNKRITNIVSRGGAILFTWMEVNNKENPFYEHYDRLLDICRKYDVTLSLGDGCRPGCLADATDACQIEELITLGELTKRAWEKDVQVMIEGPGHMAMNEIAPNMIIQKRLCHGAPFYVLGPLVTDIAPGYDHITSAIGGAIAAQAGADFLCYVTPAEHLKLPDLDDVREGIIASRIAAHAADIANGHPGARDMDDRMGRARAALNWEEMFACSMDPEKARRVKESSPTSEDDVCTMCGDMCAVRNMNEILDKSRDK